MVTGGTKGIGRSDRRNLRGRGRQRRDLRPPCRRGRPKPWRALQAKGVKAHRQAVDVADKAALDAWVADAAAELGGIDIVVANVCALAIGDDEEAGRHGFEVDMMHAVRTGRRGACPFSRRSPGAVDRHRSPASPGARSTSPPAPMAPSRPRSIHYAQAWPSSCAARASAPTRYRPATPISTAGSGSRSRRQPPISSSQRSGAQPDRPHGARRRRSPRRGLPRQPRLQLHHWHQSRDRRRPDPGRPALTGTTERSAAAGCA